VAKLLNLNESQIVETLGSAGTQAAGLWQFLEDGAMSKQLHPAHAAASGILSAELGRRGFTAARKIFEGPKGFLAAMSTDPAPEMLTEGLGLTYRISSNSFKKHASCRHTHSSIDSALLLKYAHNVRPDAVRSIQVRIYPAGYDLLFGVQPTSAYAAKFCLPYTVAAALNRGRVGLSEFDDLNDKDIRATMSRISMVRDESLGTEYPEKWPAEVAANLESGTTVSATVEYPKGDAKNPLTLGELQDKFRGLTQDVLSTAQQEHVVNIVDNLERYPTSEIWPGGIA
jgi:2-methylcitrate dehydratase PrpD